jgi:hypothetical protein
MSTAHLDDLIRDALLRLYDLRHDTLVMSGFLERSGPRLTQPVLAGLVERLTAAGEAYRDALRASWRELDAGEEPEVREDLRSVQRGWH